MLAGVSEVQVIATSMSMPGHAQPCGEEFRDVSSIPALPLTNGTNRRNRPAPIDTSLPTLTSPPSEQGQNEENTVSSTQKRRRRRSSEKFAQEWDEWGNKAEEEFSKRKQEDTANAEKRSMRRMSPRFSGIKWPRKASDSNAPPPPPDNTPTVDLSQNPLFAEIQRATSPTTRRRPSWGSLRSCHSFRVPELDPIESSESEPSSPISISPTMTFSYKHVHVSKCSARMPKTPESTPCAPLLEVAAKEAEKQLREAARAVFPNLDEHEHMDHFIDADVSSPPSRTEASESVEVIAVLDAEPSPCDVPDKQQEAKMECVPEPDNTETEEQPRSRMRRNHEKKDRFEDAQALLNAPGVQDLLCDVQKDDKLDPMRRCARPPMLGADLRFRRCPSPEPARFDCTQGTDAVRIANDYLSEQSVQAAKGESLWCGRVSRNVTLDRPSLYSNLNSAAPSRSASPGGLWAGSCSRSGRTPPRGPTGLLTPRLETNTPPSPAPTPLRNVMPPTPPASQPDFACIDEKLATEAALEEDFGDSFVTQVYNYLSLGYPSIARMFDNELSKISKIPVSELRQDDDLPTTRGYIRLGQDACPQDADIKEETCMRWRALRIYVKTWARQHPSMASEAPPGSLTAARRGSWAQ
ncbi:hypothetical protein M011DRAFT_263311 [Sporormia fimetaria CBS 119925]|uniref:Uncharacterized protein n=1 Tax=Sporormia fimetaria CBS 119925 TaxID=1340428 RepID=A0A6A6UYS7_9PLEO|nr:hypothetical protein M011DRAFT_263311 [Sporormia fimetaria CBS 119925]